ncbi:hypothetical protein F3157_22285 [Virgibacillus dakarensis]|uniref:hypothetical protein n=1 Tax=Virgibacillus dakarensis TaxID=1917889 RepID=UPI000B430459|nr:hypothetical protein [Virgibacillus dakarensis]MBT2216352.1 hypothetical protein [Virgibacillus dakarensis]MTW88310.1 hypothetical protein [Virgibacillus dakarensis]
MNKGEKKVVFMEKWGSIYIQLCTTLGALLGTYLVYIFQGEFVYEVIIAAILVNVLSTIFHLIKLRRKKDKTPEYDERTISNVFKYFAISSFIFLGVLFIFLGGITLLGHESISILYLWIFFFAYIWIIGLGVLFVKHR